MSQTSSAQALADLQQGVADLNTQITTLQSGVTSGIAQLEALIAQLQSGSGVKPEDVEAVVATLKTATANIAAVNTQIATEVQKETQ